MIETRPVLLVSKSARLFRTGSSQAVRIPREFELPGDEVLIEKEGARLILKPLPKSPRLLDMLAAWEPLDESFPDVDQSLPPSSDVTL